MHGVACDLGGAESDATCISSCMVKNAADNKVPVKVPVVRLAQHSLEAGKTSVIDGCRFWGCRRRL